MSAQPDSGNRGEHGLTAGELPDPTVEHLRRKPGVGEGGVRPRLDVPVGADDIEVPRIDVSGLDGPQGAELLGHAEQLGDRAVDLEGESLRQVRDVR
jgi:hypothetical protein